MKLKLAIIYILIFSTLTGVGYISYHGLTHLMKTLSSNLQPDIRQKQFKNLITLMHVGENNMRLYNITHLNDYLLVHKQTVKNIFDQLEGLSTECTGDTTLTAYLDSLDYYFKRKAICQEQLIRLKKTQNDLPGIMDKVLSEVDSIEDVVNGKNDSLTNQNSSEKSQKKKGLLSWLFPAKKEKNTSPDSVREMGNNPVELTEPIKEAFEEYNRKDSSLKQELMDRDIKYTGENDILSGEISETTEGALSYLDVIHAERAQSAGALFLKKSKYIAIGGTVSAVLLIIMVLVITRDFKVIIKTKKQLERAKTRAEGLARTKEEFLANMSHEIRTPLNAIIGFSKYLKGEKLSPEGKENLDIIYKSSDHLLRIINEILDFSKLEAGQMKIECIPFNAFHLIDETVQSFRKEAAEKEIKLCSEIDNTLNDYEIISDPYRIRQVLNNLVSNAIKFTDKGYVEVSARLNSASMLLITIKDTGPGIEKSTLPGIFEKFSQADNSTTRRFGGTGLGLSIVKKITELMGGKITVESAINRGSTFSVELPVSVSLIPEDHSEPDAEDRIRLDHANILVVDDDPYSLILLEKILKEHNASVATVKSGQEALHILSKHEFNIIIVDMHMPSMNGYDMIKEGEIKIPAIAISAYVDDEMIKKCLEAGFNSVYRKPVNEIEFVKSINQLLSKDRDDNPTEANFNEKTNNHIAPAGSFAGPDRIIHDRLTTLYFDSLSNTLQEIKNCTAERDFDKVKYHAHKIIPSTRHMGFTELESILKRIEAFKLMPQNVFEANKLIREFIGQSEWIREKLYEKITA